MHELVPGSGPARRVERVAYAPPNGTHAATTRPARLLVVEDDYLVGLELEYHLTAAGFAVVGIAATAEDALAIAASEKPDLAVVDIRLANESDGIEAAIALQEKFGVRSIFATAHADPPTRQRGEAAKPAGWLQKPYTSDSLIALIKATLGKAN